MRFRILLDRLSYNKTPKINRAKKTGLLKILLLANEGNSSINQYPQNIGAT
jgi:hypothetical protein